MQSKTKGEKTKEILLECAADLFLKNGYHATGINDILSAAGISKGSFYFYFSSKKELAMEVADYYGKQKMEEMSAAAETKDWERFVDAVAGSEIEKANRQESFGCPNATLGMEIAFSEPEIAQKYYETLKSQINIFADVLKRSEVSETESLSIAERAFALYEGYLLFYRMSKDINTLEKLAVGLKALVEDKK
jgi:AcrR family transcriptional regulator